MATRRHRTDCRDPHSRVVYDFCVMEFCYKHIFLPILLLPSLFSFESYAQSTTFSISGSVKDAADRSPVAYAAIYIDDMRMGVATDRDGLFSMPRIPKGKYVLSVSFLGYITQNIHIHLTGDTVVHVLLKEQTLELPEVNIMATSRNKSGSSIVIGKEAMEYIQPSSLGDVMQLLPGQLTDDGTMTSRSRLVSRQAGANANTALGMALIGDGGVPMSNNANLQQIPNDSKIVSRSTVNRGSDLRMLSTDHIQSVEVVQGIPSVRYGDLSSGTILTKAKTGKQPMEIRIKADLNSKLFYIGKGFKFSGKGGALHAGIDYSDARPDVRENLTAYKRYSLQLHYTNLLSLAAKPLQIGIVASHIGTIDAAKNDPDLTPKTDTYKAYYNRWRINHNGLWQIGRPWLAALQYSLSYDYTLDVTKRQLTVSSTSVTSLPLAQTEGEAEGIYLPAEYQTGYKMIGKPAAFFAQIEGKSLFSTGKITHVMDWGMQYRHEKNHGAGFVYNLHYPPYPTSSTASRPRRFNEVPALQNLALYIEDKASANFGEHEMEIAGGLRFTALPGIEKKYKALSGKWLAEPRINGWWKFPGFEWLNHKAFFSLRVGYGEAVKLPTLDMLKPVPDYHDFISMNYYSQNQGNSLLWITTVIKDSTNPELKPNRNRKIELGGDFHVGRFTVSALVFREISQQGFQYNAQYYTQEFNRYKTDKIFTYKPDITEFEQYKDTLLDAYSIPVNGEKIIKTGIEYNIIIPKIRTLATSIVINGAYYVTRYDVSLPVMESPNIILHGNPYKYVGIYAWNKGSFRSRFNTTVFFNTHIPKYRLIFTTTMQTVWFSTHQTIPFSGMPLSYFGAGKELTPYTEADRSDPVLRFLFKEYSDRFFLPTRSPLQFSLNLKATKEITRNISMSFYVNRLAFYSPLHYDNLESPRKIRQSPYFGTEIKIRL